MRGRELSKERGGPVAVNHSLTFCCVKTLSNTHRIECASLKYINSRAQWIGSWMNVFFFGHTVLLVLTQLVSFRFRIHGTLTTDSWPRANPLDAVYKFRKLLPMQLGQISYTETETSSIDQCYARGIFYNSPHGEALAERGYLFDASGIWKGQRSKYMKG